MRFFPRFLVFLFFAVLKFNAFGTENLPLNRVSGDSAVKQLEMIPVDFLTSYNSKKNIPACNNSSFYMHVKSVGYKILIHQTQASLDGNFWSVGELINTSSGAKDGFMIQLDNKGNFLSQNILRVNNSPVSIRDIRVDSRGALLVAGIVQGNNNAFVASLSPNLVTNWVETINFNTSPADVTLHLLEQGDFSLAVQTPQDVTCFHLGAGGNIILARQIVSGGLVTLLGYTNMVSGGNGLVTLHFRNGRYETQVTSISSAGNHVSTHIIGNNADEYKVLGIGSYSLRMAMLATRKNSTGSFNIERNIMHSSGSVETKHVYQLPGTYDFNNSGKISNAGDAFGICSPQSGKLLLVKQVRDYQTTVEYAREYNVRVGSSVNALTKAYDGGYLISLNTNDSSEVIFVKTDSTGALKGCGYQPIPVSSAETLNHLNTAAPAAFANVNFSAMPASFSSHAAAFNHSFDCNTIDCPTAPAPDTCQATYFKTLYSNSNADMLDDESLMRNNNLLFSFSKLDNLLEVPVQRRGLKLFDETGHYIKGVYLEETVSPQSTYSRLKQISDSTILYCTVTYVNNEPHISFRIFSDNLGLVSAYTLKAPPNFRIYSGGFVIGDIHKDEEGNFYLCGSAGGMLGIEPTLTVCKISPAGLPLWVKSYNIIGGGYLLDVSMTSTASSLIFVMEGGSPGSVAARMSKATGQMLNAFKYQNSGGGSLYKRLLEYDQGRIVYAGSNAGGRFVLGSFDTTAKPYKLKSLSQGSSTRATDFKNGKIYAGTRNGNNNIIMAADTALNIVFAREYSIPGGADNSLVVSDAGFVYTVGRYAHGQDNRYNSPFIKKYGTNGELGLCAGTAIMPSVSDITLNTVILPFTEFPLGTLTPVSTFPLTITPDNFGHVISSVVCSTPPACSFIDVTGPTTVCQLYTDYTYRFIRNNGCNELPLVVSDNKMAQVVNVTDTSLVVRFLSTGSTWLKATIKTGCSQFEDSILVQIQNGSVFSLGNDTTICNSNTLLLDAGNGFINYLWQDGSAAQTFTVNQPGAYRVTVKNICGESLTDTIVVRNVAMPPLFMGNDTTLCRGDTLLLNASAAFSTCEWTTNSISIGNGLQARVIVTASQQINVRATTIEGCTANDSMQIFMKTARPVNLGNDTGFCDKKTVTLNAGLGYSNYVWSSGSNTNTLTVNQSGSYWVAATDVNGCIARDTMVVVNVYPLPQINLGNDFDACLNETKRLDAGNYSSYLWQDNSNDRYFTADRVGIYYVTVTNQQFCSSSDTVQLKNIYLPPANFLPGKDSLCAYEKLDLKSTTTFKSYLWSTGSTLPAITITNPGIYILTATDNNGCKGTDTLNIYRKVCMPGMFIPNAFTPNNDGTNDLFKPTVFGILENYSIRIYNRYGQLVFVSGTPPAGWDGTFKGLKQNTGGYVWICNYKFPGQLPVVEKGNLLLIR